MRFSRPANNKAAQDLGSASGAPAILLRNAGFRYNMSILLDGKLRCGISILIRFPKKNLLS